MAAPARPYLSNGQVLESPPFSARARRFLDDSYNFLGLYVTSLLSFDAYAAAEQSPFAIRNQGSRPASRPTRIGGDGGGTGGGGGPSGGGGGGRKLGTIDDVRGPECKSCG